MHDPTKFPNIYFSKKKAQHNFCSFRFEFDPFSDGIYCAKLDFSFNFSCKFLDFMFVFGDK